MICDPLRVVCVGNTLVTGRIDGWTHKGERRSLPVMGILEFDVEGCLTGRREPFDLQTCEAVSP